MYRRAIGGVVALLCFFSLYSFACAVPAFDAATSTRDVTGTVTSLTVAHTVSGADRALLVGVMSNCPNPPIVSGVTYNGIALTQHFTSLPYSTERLDIWRLVAPATGAHNTVVTFSGTCAKLFANILSLTDVDQTTPLGTVASASGLSQLATVNVSSASGEMVIDFLQLFGSNPSYTPTAGAGQTARIINQDSSSGDSLDSSTEAGASTVTMSWTWEATNRYWNVSGVSVKPAGTPPPPPSCPPGLIASVQSGNWSTSSTWCDGVIPGAGALVSVAAGHVVTYDIATPVGLAEVLIYGILTFSRTANTTLESGLVVVLPGGYLDVGTVASPIPDGVTATIQLAALSNQTTTHLHGIGTILPALHTHGGTLDMHGAPRASTWTLLTQNAVAGATTLQVANTVNDWRVGDKIIVTGTNKMRVLGQVSDDPQMQPTVTPQGCDVHTQDFACLDPATFQVEERTIASVSGNTITLTAPLTYLHKGVYPYQGAVGNLTRNVRVISKNPTPASGRGHVMIAHGFVIADTDPLPTPLTDTVTARISFVEFADLGRLNTGVYPVHFHRLGNAGNVSHLTGSSIHHGQNLFVRLHNTNFLSIADNVGYNTLGHGFATEDGTEMFNVFSHNLASRTQHVTFPNPNDASDVNEGSGFWANNPRNSWINNYAADADAWGYQIDPITIQYYGLIGKTITPIDISGNPLPAAPATSLDVVEFSGNKTIGNYFGGLEAINLESLTEQHIYGFTAVSHRKSGLGGFANAFLLEQSVFDDGPRWNDDNGDATFYTPGNFPGIRLSTPHHRFLNSTLGQLDIGYQFPGTLIFENTAITRQASDSYGTGFLWGIKGSPRFTRLPMLIHQFPPNSTTEHEFYLFDQNGPGMHKKLIPLGTVAPDQLAYAIPSSISLGDDGCPTGTEYQDTDPLLGVVSSCYKEALFTGPTNEGVPLKMPFFLNAGADQDVIHPMAKGRDVVDAQGIRWALDSLYMESPLGYYFPRYGHQRGGAGSASGWNDDAVATALVDNTSMYGSSAIGQNANANDNAVALIYRIDVPNATYHVDLHFIERWAGISQYCGANCGVGSRKFDVKAEGVTIYTQLDVFQQAGGAAIPLVKSFTTTVSDRQLMLDFSRYAGMVSGIAVCLPTQVVNGRCAP